MRRQLTWFATATRCALVEHARNRFAMVLVALFLPAWISLIHLAIPREPVPFRLAATGELLTPRGNELTQISGALNAVCMITGFMMFAAAFASGRFDRRLAMAGYPRTHLALAKLAALALIGVGVVAYATAAIWAWTPPQQPLLLATALFSAAMTYGALGVTFGSLLHKEVEGMFAIMMISVVDIVLQNPLVSSGADSPFVPYLPVYGAVQAATAGAFATSTPLRGLGIQLIWFAAVAAIALLSFHRRTRNALSPTAIAER
ncbi:hypothetical protein [Allokutzneria sp. NRRL B-24872]|uniref:hypothetical protein n=1 Tax=Allokutzneria sp. NRRL B-24872 TaxID=1137961 RepID=UPI000A371990|nr:hypothetical protein [Allokutzneria sp. NRRL B-24872]